MAFFIDIANLGMALIALPTIQQELHYSDSELQWVMSSYTLTFGGFLLVGGRLGDILGFRTLLNTGLFLFTAFTLGCALVKSGIGLLVLRAFQGLAAALTIPSAQAHIGLFFPDESSRAMALGGWGACGSMGFVLGPIIGGALTSTIGWRWIFWLPLIISGTTFVAALIFIPSREEKRAPAFAHLLARLDLPGVLTSVPGLILLTFALTSGNANENHGWSTGTVIATLIVSVVLLTAFVVIEMKFAKDPLLPHRMWERGNPLLPSAALAAATYAVWQGSNFFLTLELQDFGFTPLQTAIRFLPLGVSAFMVNMIVPRLVAPVGPRLLFLAGWLTAIPGIVLLALLRDRDDYFRFAFPGMILYIAGVGTVYLVANFVVVGSAKPEEQGTVAGVYNMSLQVGGAVLGLAVLTAVQNGVTNSQGGPGDAHARLLGYRAAYYGAIALAASGAVFSVFAIRSVDRPKGAVLEDGEGAGADAKSTGTTMGKEDAVNEKERERQGELGAGAVGTSNPRGVESPAEVVEKGLLSA
ncbi:major facilitator superfamily domain-containing protein [Mycena capillaripes]|nr:major facilitator superfamily domain-containing protein [Mycena capillaripes]